MFSRRRLAFIISITIVFSVLFFLFNIDHDFLRSQVINIADDFSTLDTISAPWVEGADDGFIIVGNSQSDSDKLIKANTIDALKQIKAEYITVNQVENEELNGNAILIFVSSDLSQVGDLERIANHIKEGGRAIFAAGIPNETYGRFFDPVWGILERGGFTTSSEMTFNESFFPYDLITINDAYTTYSMTLRLNDACEVLIQGENENPLVWTYAYNQGRIAMINGSFMESKLSSGILIASINSTREQSIYPIQATKTVFLDAIPPLFDGNDDRSFEYYGRSAESFVRDKLWAILLQSASLHDLRLTSSFMAIDKQNFDSQNANQQTFSYISQEIIKNKGEITLSGNHVDLGTLTEARVDQTKVFFEKFFPNYTIHSYYPLYGKISQDQIDLIQKVYPSIDVIRTLLQGDNEIQSSEDYILKDGTVFFPTMTYGYKAEGIQLYTFMSRLTSHGLVSHSFDINSLFTVPTNESNWNTLNKTFDQLSDVYFRETPWLDAITISPAAERLKAMIKLRVKTKTEADQMIVTCADMTVGQKFLFYSTKEIKSINGASFERINSRYYLIEAQAASFEIVY